MATYSNQHWLLSHVRNSFISTDDTGMCETVMASDDLPKHFMRKFQDATPTNSHYSNNAHNELQQQQQRRKSNCNSKNTQRLSLDLPLQEVDFVCYPGLDQSDDEDMDQSTQSYDIQMYPEVGAHRFRSNTAQKLEKMDIARRKAARTKCVNYDEEILEPERIDLFVRKNLVKPQTLQVQHVVDAVGDDDDDVDDVDAPGKTDFIRSRLSMQLANSPKQTQNKFMEYARFDGTSQTGMQTKRINVFLSMLPEKERNYPIKICVVASAKILEVIGFVCYKATIQFPEIPLKSIRHYALYMTEDNDDMEDFPPLDNREPCSKFGFSHLTLAERRPLAPVTRIDYHPQNSTSKSLTSEEDKARLAAAAVRALQGIDLNGNDESNNELTTGANSAAAATATVGDDSSINYADRMDIHNDMLEAPIYRSYRLHIIDKRFFKTEVTLGISGERIEIDQHKNVKFWTKQKAVTYPIDSIAFCEIVERRNQKAILRIWLKSSSSSSTASAAAAAFAANNSANIDIIKSSTLSVGGAGSNVATPHSPTSPGHYPSMSSPFAMFAGATAGSGQPHLRFKHYDFEANLHMADHILHKLNCILDVCSSELRRDFLQMRERKSERAKKHLKMF